MSLFTDHNVCPTNGGWQFFSQPPRRAMFIRSPEFDGWRMNSLPIVCRIHPSKVCPRASTAMFMDSFDLSLAVLFAEMESRSDFQKTSSCYFWRFLSSAILVSRSIRKLQNNKAPLRIQWWNIEDWCSSNARIRIRVFIMQISCKASTSFADNRRVYLAIFPMLWRW